MLNRLFPLASCLIVSGLALAQVTASAPVLDKILGKSVEVQGLVTVSNGTQVAAVTEQSPVVNLTRYVTSSTGYVTLKFDKGCEVKLKPNETVLVDEDDICDRMILAIKPVPGAVVGGAGPTTVMAIVGLLLLPNGGGSGSAGSGGSGGQLPDPPLSGQ
jgi:hypothetical protein